MPVPDRESAAPARDRAWTPDQLRAIRTLDRDVCVSAGAGSGKTGVLVARFVGIVRGSLDGSLPEDQRAGLSDILVFTFTEKATKEMKSRIVEDLTAAGLHEERRQVESAYISTIHGFCSRLLKENPFEAGVDPGYEVLDDAATHRLRRAAFERALERAHELDDAEVLDLIASVQGGGVLAADAGDPVAVLARAVDVVLNKLRGYGIRRVEWDSHLRGENSSTGAATIAAIRYALRDLIADLRAAVSALGAIRAGAVGAMELTRRALLDRLAAVVEAADAPDGDGLALLALLGVLNKDLNGSLRPRPERSGADADLRAVVEHLRNVLGLCRELYDVQVENERAADTLSRRLSLLVARTWEAYNDAKREAGALDNDDLQAEAVHLLEASNAVRSRYARRFRYVMVDEFQDTSDVQVRLLRALGVGGEVWDRHDLADIPSPAPTGGTRLFLVGDIQQSIYGFRSAEPSIFRHVVRSFSAGRVGEHVSLTDNFRSRPDILAFVSALFERMWRGHGEFDPLKPMGDFADKPAPSVECFLAPPGPRAGYVAMEARAMAMRIRHIVEAGEIPITDRRSVRRGDPVRYGDIAVLFRSHMDVETYEAAFAGAGVPFFVVGGGRGYFARREVRDILNLLTVVDMPLDDLALVACLRSPIVGLDVDTLLSLSSFVRALTGSPGPIYTCLTQFVATADLIEGQRSALRSFVSIVEQARADEDKVPVGRLLERLVMATQYDARLLVRPNGRRRLANLRKLMQMAYAETGNGVGGFIRRLREIEKLTEREGDAPTEEEAANVVRLITIHKAKGLEFPVVVLADMGRSLVHEEKGMVVCDPVTRAVACRIGEYASAPYRAIARRRRDADLEESNRLLYVAVTRAREHLILCGPAGGRARSSNWADVVFPHAGIVSAPSEMCTMPGPGGARVCLVPMAAYADPAGTCLDSPGSHELEFRRSAPIYWEKRFMTCPRRLVPAVLLAALIALPAFAQRPGTPPGAPTIDGLKDNKPSATAQRAAKLFEIAIAHQRAGRVVQAIAAYKQLIVLAPGAFPAYVNLAGLYQARGETREAEVALKTAAAIEPKNPIPPMQLATVYLLQHRAKDARAQAEKAVALDPKQAQAHFTLGGADLALNDLAGAEKCFREAIRLAPQQARSYFNLGFVLSSQKRHPEAEAAFERAAKLEPSFGQTYLLLGVARQNAGDLPGAISAYERAEKALPGSPAPAYNLGLVYQALAAKTNQQKYIQEAISAYLRSIALAPDNLPAHANVARQYFAIRNYVEAARHFREASRLRPSDYRLVTDAGVAETWASMNAPDIADKEAFRKSAEARFREVLARQPSAEAYGGLAYLFESQTNYDKAATVYEQWSARYPKDIKPLLALGRVMEIQKKSGVAAKLYDRVIAIAPKDPQGYLALGHTYEIDQKFDQALEQYRRVTALDPKNTDALRRIAQAYVGQKKTVDAVAAYDALKRLDPKDTAPYYAVAGIYERDKKYEEALREYRALLAMTPKDLGIHSNIARVLEEEKKYEDAIAVYREIEKIAPNDRYYVASIPRLYEAEGKPDLALAECKRLREKDPKNMGFRNLLASILERQGKNQEAIKEYEGIVDADPTATYAWSKIGTIYQAMKKPDDARNAFMRLLDKQPDSYEALAKLEGMYTEEKRDDAWFAFLRSRVSAGGAGQNVFNRFEALAVRLQKVDDAIAALKEAVTKTHNERNTLLFYAGFLTRHNHAADSIEPFRTVAQNAPDDYGTRLSLAGQLEVLNRIPETIKAYEEIVAIKTVPANLLAGYRMKLGGLYEKNGQKALALKQYQEVAKADPKNTAAIESVKRLGG